MNSRKKGEIALRTIPVSTFTTRNKLSWNLDIYWLFLFIKKETSSNMYWCEIFFLLSIWNYLHPVPAQWTHRFIWNSQFKTEQAPTKQNKLLRTLTKKKNSSVRERERTTGSERITALFWMTNNVTWHTPKKKKNNSWISNRPALKAHLYFAYQEMFLINRTLWVETYLERIEFLAEICFYHSAS